jgi:hypothetical protein
MVKAQSVRIMMAKDVTKIQTLTGIKCAFSVLAAKINIGNGTSDQEAALELINGSPGLINPLFSVPGVNGHRDTPVEILHTLLLGGIKQAASSTISAICKNKEKKMVLLCRMQNLHSAGFPSTINARQLVNYIGSGNGKDFKVIAQTILFTAYGLIEPEWLEMWQFGALVTRLAYCRVIENVQDFSTRLRVATVQFVLRLARLDIRFLGSRKLHLQAAHLADDVAQFGPAPGFATESFESFNSTMRGVLIYSNRQAPSRDSARRFYECAVLRHVVSGGFYRQPGNKFEWVQCGSSIIKEFENPSVSKLFGYQHRRLRFERTVWSAVTKQPLPISYHADAQQLLEAVNYRYPLATKFQAYKGVKFDQDCGMLRLGEFFIYERRRVPTQQGERSIARVQDILHLTAQYGIGNAIWAQCCELDDSRLHRFAQFSLLPHRKF